jgi:hypothetical protein
LDNFLSDEASDDELLAEDLDSRFHEDCFDPFLLEDFLDDDDLFAEFLFVFEVAVIGIFNLQCSQIKLVRF